MPHFLDGAQEEVVANPQWSGCVACCEKDQCSHAELRITRAAREQTPVPCVAEREAQKVAEREPNLLQLRIRNGRHNGDLTDQGPARTRDNSVETCPMELGQNPREILQGSAGVHREIELTRN